MTEHEWLTGNDPVRMLDYVNDWLRTPGQIDVSDRKLRLIACAYVRQMWPLLTDKRSRMAVEVAERYADGEATSEERGKAFNAADNLRGFQRDAAYACLRADASLCVPEVLDAIGDLDRRDRAKQAALVREVIGCSRGHKDCPTHKPDWLTQQVLSLAAAAYEDRPGRACNACKGTGRELSPVYDSGTVSSTAVDIVRYSPITNSTCPDCYGSGLIHDGALDNVRLAVLADALEEAGCPVTAGTESEMVAVKLKLRECPCGNDRYARRYCVDCEKLLAELHRLQSPHLLLAHLRSHGPHVRGCFVLDLILGKV